MLKRRTRPSARPDIPFELPEYAPGHAQPPREFKVFDLIWKRTIASQWPMPKAAGSWSRSKAAVAFFQVTGKTIDFPGYLRAYVEGTDDPDAELADQERTLPSVRSRRAPQVCRHDDQGSLDSAARSIQRSGAHQSRSKRKGIGRPSTYASIIDTIQAPHYVFKKGGALVPTWVAFSVVQLLEDHLASLVDYQFTAQMEDDLDAISRGEREHVDYLKSFYFGNGTPGLKPQLKNKVEEIDARGISRVLIGNAGRRGTGLRSCGPLFALRRAGNSDWRRWWKIRP